MAFLTEDMKYVASSTDRLKEMNNLLGQDLSDLKNELEENEMVHGITRPIRYSTIQYLLKYILNFNRSYFSALYHCRMTKPIFYEKESSR